MVRVALLLACMMLLACASPPSKPENICSIFDEKDGWLLGLGNWYSDAERAEERWGSPIAVMMAIMYQESSFESRAKPPRARFLGIPLWYRTSSSYGYSQAKDDTWKWYEKSTGRNADRDDFDDAIDFIGWYNHQSHTQNGLSKTDTYSLYLAYHEGHGGYRNGTYKNKAWLLEVASKVSSRAARYQQQLNSCK